MDAACDALADIAISSKSPSEAIKAAKAVQTLAMKELKRVGTVPQSSRLASVLKDLLQVVRAHAEGGGNQGQKLATVARDVKEAAKLLRGVDSGATKSSNAPPAAGSSPRKPEGVRALPTPKAPPSGERKSDEGVVSPRGALPALPKPPPTKGSAPKPASAGREDRVSAPVSDKSASETSPRLSMPNTDEAPSPDTERHQLEQACVALLTAVAAGPKDAVAATKAVQTAAMQRLRSAKVRLESLDGAQRKKTEDAVANMATILKELVAAIRLFARNEATADTVVEWVGLLRAVDLDGSGSATNSPRRSTPNSAPYSNPRKPPSNNSKSSSPAISTTTSVPRPSTPLNSSGGSDKPSLTMDELMKLAPAENPRAGTLSRTSVDDALEAVDKFVARSNAKGRPDSFGADSPGTSPAAASKPSAVPPLSTGSKVRSDPAPSSSTTVVPDTKLSPRGRPIPATKSGPASQSSGSLNATKALDPPVERGPYQRRVALPLKDPAHRLLISALDDAVDELCQWCEEKGPSETISDEYDDEPSTRVRGALCSALANLFAHRFKVPSSWFGSLIATQTHFWQFIYSHATNASVTTVHGMSLQKCLKMLQGDDKAGRDDNARFRSFVVMGVNQQKLTRWLHELMDNSQAVDQYYDGGSLFADRDARLQLISALKPLERYNWQLDLYFECKFGVLFIYLLIIIIIIIIYHYL